MTQYIADFMLAPRPTVDPRRNQIAIFYHDIMRRTRNDQRKMLREELFDPNKGCWSTRLLDKYLSSISEGGKGRYTFSK